MLDRQAAFSRVIATDGLDASGVVHEIEASVDERTALARRFGLKSLDGLTATVQLKPVGGGMVRVDGRFMADVVQTCVVTLEPIAAHIADSFTVDYSPEVEDGSHREVIIAPDAEDPPEPLVDRKIVIGEATTNDHLKKPARGENGRLLNLARIAQAVTADEVVFATTAANWSEGTRGRIAEHLGGQPWETTCLTNLMRTGAVSK